jgi:hypothetical protein
MGRVLVEIEDPEGYPDPRTVHCGVQSTELSLHKGEKVEFLFLSYQEQALGIKMKTIFSNKEPGRLSSHLEKLTNFSKIKEKYKRQEEPFCKKIQTSFTKRI